MSAPIVDGNFVRIGTKSYAINKINSLDVRQRKPNGCSPIVVTGFLSFGCVVAATIAHGWWHLGLALVAILFAYLARVAWQQSKIVEYTLLFTTSSKEIAALKTTDGALMDRVTSQIESAISQQPG